MSTLKDLTGQGLSEVTGSDLGEYGTGVEPIRDGDIDKWGIGISGNLEKNWNGLQSEVAVGSVVTSM